MDEDGLNPLAQALGNTRFGAYKPGQLGAAPTLGNEQAQSEYAALVQALTDQQSAESRQGMAQTLMQPEYIQNSGLLGSIAMMARAGAGKRMDRKAREQGADAQTRVLRETDAMTSKREQARAEAEAAKIARNEEILRSGDAVKIAAHGLKMPEQERAEYDIREVGGQLYYVPKSPQAAAPQASGNTPAADAGFDMLREAVKWQESRGNPNAVSPKGAIGTMQTMPGTLRDPGYGVAPARNNSPQELERVGVDYLQAMTGKYGTSGGLAAYNWGPGNWEKALQRAGGDPEAALAMAPAETRAYVPGVLKRAQGGMQEDYQQTGGGTISPKAQEAQRRRDLREMQAAGVPLTQGMANTYLKSGQFGNGAPAGAIPVPGIPRSVRQGDTPSGYRWTGNGNLEAVPGGPADRKQNPVASDLAKGEMAMRKEVEDRVKQDRSILNMYRNIEGATKNATAAGDLSAIFAYMKMLDPGSVVREQEFANAQNAAGIPDRVRNLYNQAMQGTRLNPNQRAEFMAEARKIAEGAQDRVTGVSREYQGIAEQYGYDTTRATGFPDFRNVSGRPAPANDIDDLLNKYGGAK